MNEIKVDISILYKNGAQEVFETVTTNEEYEDILYLVEECKKHSKGGYIGIPEKETVNIVDVADITRISFKTKEDKPNA